MTSGDPWLGFLGRVHRFCARPTGGLSNGSTQLFSSFEGPADVALTLLECGCASTYPKGSRSYRGLFFPLEIVVCFPGWERGCFLHLCMGFGQQKSRHQVCKGPGRSSVTPDQSCRLAWPFCAAHLLGHLSTSHSGFSAGAPAQENLSRLSWGNL